MGDRLSDAKGRLVRAKQHAAAFHEWWSSEHRPTQPEDDGIQEDMALLAWLCACEYVETLLMVDTAEPEEST